MKREAIFKIILVLIMGVVLFARPVFAVTSNPTDLNDFWEDQGSLDDVQGEKPTTPEPTTPTTPTTPEPTTPAPVPTTPSTNTTTNTNTDLPKAGLVEDTMMIVSILALTAVAVFAFVKISDYSNI